MREKQGESDEAQGRKMLGGFCDRRKNGWPRMDPEVDQETVDTGGCIFISSET